MSVRHQQVAVRLFGLSIVMFGFGFLLVPLYDVFCEVTGLNGKTADEAYDGALVTERQVDKQRKVQVLFVASNNADMHWQFYPMQSSITVHPGEPATVMFYARNPAGYDMTAQAVPSLVPSKAANYFHKTECFCFNQQPLAAGADTEMGLRFIVDPELPDNIRTITLSYTLFDITGQIVEEPDQASTGDDIVSL